MKAPSYAGKLERRVKCKSGVMGTRTRLRNLYRDFEEWCDYSSIYGQAKRLNSSEEALWAANPVIEWSVNTADYRIAFK